ncbi:hypothetical protein KKD61_04505, partial [Patescibacteria group bacterium]|nr:hypothetical protein [Patescibacteria group bacterium]
FRTFCHRERSRFDRESVAIWRQMNRDCRGRWRSLAMTVIVRKCETRNLKTLFDNFDKAIFSFLSTDFALVVIASECEAISFLDCFVAVGSSQ